MKTCSKCNSIQSISFFSKDRTKPDGLDSWCKPCRNSYKHKNKHKFQDSKNQWKKDNKYYVNAINAKRRADKVQRTPLWLSKTDHNKIQEFYSMAKELETVFPWKQHIDHIVPLLGENVCGFHVPWNLQILSAKANIEKGNKHNV